MKRSIALYGEGTLYEHVQDVLSASYRVLNGVMSEADAPLAVISLHDHRALEEELHLQQRAQDLHLPYLRVHLHGDRSYAGPWVLPQAGGCVHCVETRLRTAHPNRDLWASIERTFGDERYRQADKPWSPAFLDLIAQLVLQDVQALEKAGDLRLRHHLYVSFDHTAKGRLHRFHPVPDCPHCGRLPLDTAEGMTLRFQERTKPDPRSYRLPNPAIRPEVLRREFYDWRTGMFNHVYRDPAARYLPLTGAELPVPPDAKKLSEIGFGRTMTYADSELTSYLEGLERYAGMTPLGKRTAVRGSYRQLQSKGAVNPRSLYLHEPSQQQEPGYGYVSYDDDLEFNWVYAYSWQQQQAVLIPEQMAYYRIETTPDRPVNRFVYETSNGCAMGGSLEEAVYYALLEVIERDAFLVAWYNRLPLTEILLDDVEDRDILLLRDRMERDGYRLHLFDMKTDSGIPGVWALIINPDPDAKVKTYSAAGAHPNPEKAMLGAMVEAITSVPVYEQNLHLEHDLAERMLHDASLVQTMRDHVLLHSHPEAVTRFDFLFAEGRDFRTVRDLYPQWYETAPPQSLTEELTLLLERLLQICDDLYIVDQTTPELASIGVKAVRVNAAGMLTMTFGHQYRRIVEQRVQTAHVNLDPHPFP